MPRRWTPEEESWLIERYANGSIEDTARAFERDFGYARGANALYVKAGKLGLSKSRRTAPRKAVRAVRWSCEPEKQAWMEQHDVGQKVDVISTEFAQAFGFPLSYPQVCLWRSINGRQRRKGRRGGGRPPVPVGTERECKGYIFVKVRDKAAVPQSKDNWRMKQVHVYEQAHGVAVDGNECVMFADHDTRNFDPANLVLVPRRLTARVNNRVEEWHDADSLRAVIASEELNSAILDAEGRLPRTCEVCGDEFLLKKSQRGHDTRTCPSCIEKGHRYRGHRRAKSGPKIKACAVCGQEFEPQTSVQVRCPDCIARKPNMTADKQRRWGK